MAMERHLEDLKILADVNDPVIKKRFEDGQGKHYHCLDLQSVIGRSTHNP